MSKNRPWRMPRAAGRSRGRRKSANSRGMSRNAGLRASAKRPCDESMWPDPRMRTSSLPRRPSCGSSTGGGKPQNVHPLQAAPAWRLRRLLDPLLPGWEQVLRSRWSALDLIQISDNIADAAFLNVVHMYKKVLGNRFPPGVFEWPRKRWLKTYRERKARAAAAGANEETDKAASCGARSRARWARARGLATQLG